ncbi:MAG: hypothetical protein K8S87_08660 [Planctomycetes bacterium]|nr:hypothetical protein [Planctomycetota bacterium]
MNLDRFEKDFNKWMLVAHNENNVLRQLLDEKFQKDVDELGKHFRSDAAAFVIDLQDLVDRIFTDGIAKHEKMENIQSSHDVLRILKNRKRIRKDQIDVFETLNSLSPNDYNGIAFPSKSDFDNIKKLKGTQVLKLVDFEKSQIDTSEEEENYLNRLTDSEKDEFQNSKTSVSSLKLTYDKYAHLITAYKAMTTMASWYYRMYKETPDLGFQWELSDDDTGLIDRERVMMVGDYAGCLSDKYNIMKSPFRMYDKPVSIENTVQVDKIIEVEVPMVTVKEMPVDKIVQKPIGMVRAETIEVEKQVIQEVPVKVHTEVTSEKQVEVPFTVTNSVSEEKLVQKDSPVYFTKELKTRQLVEIPMIVAKTLQKRTIIEKPLEIIKEVEVQQEFEKPVAVTKLMKPPSFFVAAGFVLMFAIIGIITGFMLRLILMPPGDEMLIEQRDKAVVDMDEAFADRDKNIKLAKEDADTRISAALKAQQNAETARDTAISEKKHVFDQIALQKQKIEDNDRQINNMSARISALEITRTNLESENTTLKAEKSALENDKARLEKQLSDNAGLSKQQLIDLQNELESKDTEIENLKDKHKQSILDLREEYNEKIDKIVKDYDDKILDKDKDIREHKIEINALTRDKKNLETQVSDLKEGSSDASTKLIDLRNKLAETENKLAKSEDSLAQANRNLESERRKHKITQDSLSTTEADLKKTKDELTLTKEDLTQTSIEREQFKNSFESEERKHKITSDELKKKGEELDDANATIDKTNQDLASRNRELGDSQTKVSELETEVDLLKRQLDLFGDKDRMIKEERILLEAAFSTRTRTRAIKIKGDIDEFLKKYHERTKNFDKAYEFLQKAMTRESDGKTDEKTAEEFKLLAELTKGTAYFSPSAEELPGILNEILNRELGLAKSADIVLLIDTTSTMKNDIETLKAEVAKVAKKIKDICPDVRTSIVCYRDLPTQFGNPGYIYKIMSGFTIKTQKVQNAIKNITLSVGKGNYDMPEAVYEGIMGSLTDLHWSHRAEKKMIILMGDAPPATGKKVYVDKRTGRTVDLKAEHKFTISSIKKKLEEIQLELESDNMIQIFPIIIAED